MGSVGIIPLWFVYYRSPASAMAASGSGLGGLCYSLGFQAMITSLGYHWSFSISAAVAFTLNSLCVMLLRDRNDYVKPSQKSFDIDQVPAVLSIVWVMILTPTTCKVPHSKPLGLTDRNKVAAPLALGLRSRSGPVYLPVGVSLAPFLPLRLFVHFCFGPIW